jgi:hypothetical protein
MFVTIGARKYNTDTITLATVFPNLVIVHPVEFHEVRLIGEEGKRMVEALKQAGFVGTETLINAKRVSVIEDLGDNMRLWIEGMEKIAFVSRAFAAEIEAAVNGNFPAQERVVIQEGTAIFGRGETAEQQIALSKARKKKASE